MNREQSYIRMLAASATIQHHLAVILEAKADELAKAGAWTIHHVRTTLEQEQQLKEAIKIHEQLIEIIEGVTKVETGLARHLKLAVGEEEEESSAADAGDLGKLFDI